MVDIVEKLRSDLYPYGTRFHDDRFKAANEIEKLRHDINAIRSRKNTMKVKWNAKKKTAEKWRKEAKALHIDLKTAHYIAALLSEAWEVIYSDLYDKLGEEKQETIRRWIAAND